MKAVLPSLERSSAPAALNGLTVLCTYWFEFSALVVFLTAALFAP